MASAVKNLLFRDVGLVMPSIVPFAIVFGGMNHLLRQADKTSHLKQDNKTEYQEMRGPLGWALDAAQTLGGKMADVVADATDQEIDRNRWANYARGVLRTGLLIGSAFTAFNLPYAASKEVFNDRQAAHEAEAEGKPTPKKQPVNQGYDALGRGMTTGVGKLVFRDAGSIFMGALALGAVNLGVKQLSFFKKVPDRADGEVVPSGERWVKDYVPAAAGYAAFYETVMQYRKAYDGFWKHRDEKQAQKADPEAHAARVAEEQAKPKGHYRFFTDGLGRVIFRNAASVVLGFAPHRAIRMATNNLMGLEDGKPIEDGKNRFVDWVVNAAGAKDNPERKAVVADTLREGLGTGFGFTAGYMLVGEAYRQAYDALFKRLEAKAAGAARG